MRPPIPTIDQLRPWIEWRFDRAGGPGGQNVNKVNTRATLLFDFERCDELSEWRRGRIRSRYRTRLDADGRLRIVSQEKRTQLENRAAAELRLTGLLEKAFHVDPPRKPTKPTAGAKRRRLADKRRRSETKSQRRGEI